MNITVPPEGNPEQQNDSDPTAAEQPAVAELELAEYPIADEELLARLDPEIQELARHIGDHIANLTSQVDEQQQEIDHLEVRVRDLVKVAKVFAQSGKAEAIIDSATEGRRTAYLTGWADGAAGRTLAAEGIDSAPEETDAGTPAVRAFLLGREIEQRRWRRWQDDLAHTATGWLAMAGEIDPQSRRAADDRDPTGTRATTLRLCARTVLAVVAGGSESGEPADIPVRVPGSEAS